MFIQRTLSRRGPGYALTSPKTRRGIRNIVLTGTLISELKQLRIHQIEEKLAAGGNYIDEDFVFAGHTGQPLDERNIIRRHFKPLLERSGISTRVRLYDLRHTCATLMLRAGVNPKVVSERLGHADITLTLNTYSHVLPEMQQNAVARLDVLFGN